MKRRLNALWLFNETHATDIDSPYDNNDSRNESKTLATDRGTTDDKNHMRFPIVDVE